MDSKQMVEYLDQNRWLMNNGLLNDGIKNQLYMYGSIVHKEVSGLQLDIVVETKTLSYTLYFDANMLATIERYKTLSQATSLIGLWRFKRMLKKHGNLNFSHLVNKFVKDFCGPVWTASVTLMDIKDYAEGFNDGTPNEGVPADQQPD